MPALTMPASTSPVFIALRPRAPATRCFTSSKAAPFFSIATTSSETAFFSTREVLRIVRKIRLVSRSPASTSACLTLSWIGASFVHMKRVPMLMPCAPSARQAAIWQPSAMPPEASTGILQARTAAGIRMRFVTSSSPGWPAHSKPSMRDQSTPCLSAESAWRTEVHLCTTVMPCSLNFGTTSRGLLPAVSTILMPESMIACMYSA